MDTAIPTILIHQITVIRTRTIHTTLIHPITDIRIRTIRAMGMETPDIRITMDTETRTPPIGAAKKDVFLQSVGSLLS